MTAGTDLNEKTMADPMVKATPVNSLATFVRQTIGDERAGAIAGELDPNGTGWFSGRLLAHEQVPLSKVNEFTVLAAQAAGEPVESFARAAGRYGAEQGTKTVYKFIMVLLSPESVLKTAPLMWKRVYDRGQLKVEIGGKTARVTVSDFPAHAAGCGRITGWFEVIGEKSAEGMRTAHDQCRVLGASQCSWSLEWK